MASKRLRMSDNVNRVNEQKGRHAYAKEHLEVISAIGLGLGLAMALVPGAAAQQNPVTAIDIVLEPDATMVQHAEAANERLLKSFPKGLCFG